MKLDEEDKALLLLTSLPKSYEHLVTTMTYGKDTLNMEEVTSTLVSNEIRRKPSSSSSLEDSGEGLIASTTRRSNDKGKGDHSRSQSSGKSGGM